MHLSSSLLVALAAPAVLAVPHWAPTGRPSGYPSWPSGRPQWPSGRPSGFLGAHPTGIEPIGECDSDPSEEGSSSTAPVTQATQTLTVASQPISQPAATQVISQSVVSSQLSVPSASRSSSASQPTGSSSSAALPSDGTMTGTQDALSDQQYADISLYHHNIHRQNHSSANVAWDTDLASKALEKAKKCDWSHDIPAEWGISLGSNLAGSSLSTSPGDDGTVPPNPSTWITNGFYNSEMPKFPAYGQSIDESGFENWGHFSQLVWPATEKVGCASSPCEGGWFGVCLYNPPGNYNDEYSTIGKPKGEATVCGNGNDCSW